MPRLSLLAALALAAPLPAADRPNVLWVTCEDMSPHLGCYGDATAVTPNLDRLAARSLRYKHVWSNAPVCAPARTTLISGMYPPSTGSEHMRSEVPPPAGTAMYPQLLRAAGYYCTNNNKEDYNLAKPGRVWDASAKDAHYKNRPVDAPFFAVFNLTTTHESQLRTPGHTLVHDPAKVRVPAYHPDAPEVRRDWAQSADKVTQMDGQVGKLLADLERDGLADDTVVWFYADHGSGMPRSKRTACNSGLAVPLIVHFPAKWKHLAPPDYAAGAATDRLVSFVDFAPTLLSLCGVHPPKWMQGRAFLGPHAAGPRQYVFGFRGRMDERIDYVRSARDGRYVYVRNFLPHLPHGQHVAYQFATPTTRAWKRLYDEGKVTDAQAAFWRSPRAPEELYDLESDPDEVKNLAGDPKYAAELARLGRALTDHLLATRDVGLLPEAEMLRRAAGKSPRDIADYPAERVLAAADLASRLNPEATPRLRKLLAAAEPGVRYWAVMGLLMRGEAGEDVAALLSDVSPAVRVAAAEALASRDVGSRPALDALVTHADPTGHGMAAAVQALNAIDRLTPKAPGLKEAVRSLPRKDPKASSRTGDYAERLADHILGRPRKE